MSRWMYACSMLVMVVACGESGDAPCSSDACASACASAGFGSGTCVDDACQCTAPDPLPGSISGTALLFAHTASDPAHDHAGVTVSIVGTTFTTTTAADGSYVLSEVPPGDYALTFSKAKFLDVTIPSVSVDSTSTTVTPTVTLTHGTLVGTLSSALTNAYLSGSVYSPDRKRVLLAAATLNRPVTIGALATDGSSDVVIHTLGLGYGGTPPYTRISNDSVVFVDGRNLWARPSDASTPAHVIVPIPAGTGSGLLPLGSNSRFVFVQVADSTKSPPYSLVSARTDGSGSAIVWTQTAVSQYAVFLDASDDYFIYAIADGAGTTSAIHAFNPTTGTDTIAPLNGLANGNFVNVAKASITPDKQWILLTGNQNGVPRTLVYHVGATTVAISPSASIITASTIDVEPMADSSGFSFLDGNSGIWFWGTTVTPSPNPRQLITLASNNGNQPLPTHLHGSAVIFTDTADSNRLKLVTVPTAGALTPTTYLLDSLPRQTYWQVNDAQTELRGVWTVGAPNAQLKGVTIPLPITAAPSVATLGAPLSTACTSTFDNSLATGLLNGPFFYLCPDTNTLWRFSPPFVGNPAAVQVDAPVVSMQPILQDRAAYLRADGTWWTVDAAAKALVSRFASTSTIFVAVGKWLFFGDDNLISRVSRLDGSTIDEPLVDCMLSTPYASWIGTPVGEYLPTLVGPNLLAPTAECNGLQPNPYVVSQANLP